MTIFFRRTKEEHGYCSNFYHYAPFEYDGKAWKTSEHAYQAQKFRGTDDEYAEAIRDTNSAWWAAKMGRDGSKVIRLDWEYVKLQVMFDIVLAKFEQNGDICDKLLDTGDEDIVERSDRDSFWGDGIDGRGKNYLGKIIVKVRTRLRNDRS